MIGLLLVFACQKIVHNVRDELGPATYTSSKSKQRGVLKPYVQQSRHSCTNNASP